VLIESGYLPKNINLHSLVPTVNSFSVDGKRINGRYPDLFAKVYLLGTHVSLGENHRLEFVWPAVMSDALSGNWLSLKNL
jgi:hypothetical protein